MKKLLLFAAISLGGCTTLNALSSATLTTTQVYAAASAFDTAEITATNYLRLPLCGTATICRTQVASAAVVAAGRGGIQARRTLVTACLANISSSACVGAYTTVTTAVSGLQSVFTQYGILKGS